MYLRLFFVYSGAVFALPVPCPDPNRGKSRLLLSRPSAVQEGEEEGGGEGQEGKGVQEQVVRGDRCGCVCGAAGEAARIRPAAGSGIAGSRCIFSCLLRVVSVLPFPAELGRAKA